MFGQNEISSFQEEGEKVPLKCHTNSNRYVLRYFIDECHLCTDIDADAHSLFSLYVLVTREVSRED